MGPVATKNLDSHIKEYKVPMLERTLGREGLAKVTNFNLDLATQILGSKICMYVCVNTGP